MNSFGLRAVVFREIELEPQRTQEMLKKTLWLVDGSSLACRGFFAFIRSPLRNSRGENTSAIFGFVNSLFKLLNEKKPEYLLVSFDAEGPTFRHQQFKEYKATRPKLPRELPPQIPVIKHILNLMGIKTLEVEGVEADDVIGTLTESAKRDGFETIIFSEDKDFLQLESQEIKIFNPRTFEFTYSQEKLGIPSKWVSDFLALTGDTIDNIPGVPGIGPKTASKLINKFGGIEGIFNNLSQIEQEKTKKAIEENREQILSSKKLTTIRCDCDIKIGPDDLRIGERDESTLISIFRELEFFSIIKKLKPTPQVEVIPSQAGSLCHHLERVEVIPLEVIPLNDFLKSIKEQRGIISISVVFFESYFSLACDEEKAFVFRGKENEEVSPQLVEVMEQPEIKKITPDSKLLFRKFDSVKEVSPQGVFDLVLASYLLKSEIRNHSIDELATLWLGEPLSTLDFKKRNFSEQELINWLGKRAIISNKLYGVLKKELEEKKLYKLFCDIEMPLARVLANMEEVGVLIDRDYFAQESSVLEGKLKELEEEIYKSAGERFNLRSPLQISHILFEKLGYPKSKRTKKGYSTDQEVLAELAKNYEIPKKLLEYRELFKMKSTYLDAIPALVDSMGRVHTTWQQTITATGRLSSTNPNLQNIPRKEVRKGFIAPPNWLILSADYSQIELRILASISGDDTLREAFEQNEDIHTKTASLIFGIPESEVTPDERKKAKVVNFGIVYGMGPYGLSQRLKIGVEEASTFIASYFLTYPGVKRWIDELLDFVRKNGYVETLLGRRRWLSGINSDNARVREFEERAAINAPIQGTAADMIKVAMIRIHEKLKGLKSRIVLQVHDELVLEIPEGEVDEVKELVWFEMEHGIELKVPVVVDIGIGENWYSAH